MCLQKHIKSNDNIDKINSDLHFIKIQLVEYLKDLKHIEKSIEIEQLLKHTLLLKVSPNDRLIVINFNYTNTVNLYFENKETIAIYNIHGNLDDDINSICFGYGNDSSSAYQEIERTGNKKLQKYIKRYHYD